MFKKNDVYLRIYYIIFDIMIFLGLLAAWIFAVISFAEEMVGLGLILLLVVPVLLAVIWVTVHLLLSVASDIKLIRDKLYDTSNPYAKPFSFRALLFGDTKSENALMMQKRMEKNALVKLLNDGVITREEYEKRITRI